MTTFHSGGGGSSLTSADNSFLDHCEGAEREQAEAGGLCEGKDRNAVYCDVPKARQHTRHWWSFPCHGDVLAEGSQDNPPTLALPPTLRFGNRVAQLVPRWLPLFLKDGREKLVSEAHSKELNVLKSYRLNDFKKKVAFTLAPSLLPKS